MLPRLRAQRDVTPARLASAIPALFALACSPEAPSDQTTAVSFDTLDDGRLIVTNGDMAHSAGSGSLRLVATAEIRDVQADGSTVFLEEPVSLAVDRRGRIYVADGPAMAIRVYDAGGNLLRSIGRSGAGPGEFRTWLSGIAWQEPNRLWVADAARIMAFDSAGEFVDGSARSRGGAMSSRWEGQADGSGFVYSQVIEMGFGDASGGPVRFERLVRFRGADGAAAQDTFPLELRDEADSRLVDRGGGIYEMAQLPMAGRRIWAVSPAGTIWMAHTSEYRLDEASFAGDTLRTVMLERSPEPLEGPERDSVADASSAFSIDELPAFKPAMNGLYIASDGWIWVRLRPAPTVDWDVFDGCGRHLGRVVSLHAVTFPGGRAVVGVSTGEFDVPRVVQLELQAEGERLITTRECEFGGAGGEQVEALP